MTAQLSLWATTPATAKPSHVVEVNECAIFATRMGADWWNLFRYRQPGRIDVTTMSVAGDRVDVRCADREHAEWLTDQMIQHGIPRSAVRARVRKSEPTEETDHG